MGKRPAFQFYPGDWLRDTALRTCSIAARGLWMDMICFMHEGKPYGHLKVNDKVIDNVTLGRMVGIPTSEATSLLGELEGAGVFIRNESGAISSKRMIEDEKARKARATGGALGGNPKLVGEYNKPGFLYVFRRESDDARKIGISVNPSKRLYKVRQQFRNDTIEIEHKLAVNDMGAKEARLHKALSAYKIVGEWYDLDENGERILQKHLMAKDKVKAKETPTPSSSSSSSSSSADKSIGDTLVSPRRSAKPRTDWGAVMERWNALAEKEGRQPIVSMSDTRRTHYLARLKQDPDFWAVLEREVGRLDEFTRSKTWFTFDWIIKSPDNYLKLSEGNYRDDGRGHSDRQETTVERIRREHDEVDEALKEWVEENRDKEQPHDD